jgi:hydrogenase nickel incorporation protein HypB
MCDLCGAGEQNVVPVDVCERILATNERFAQRNREDFRDHGVIAVNLMGAAGSGKTAVLEATARALGRAARVGALTGNPAVDTDARRIRAAGIVAESINTGTASHLDAEMVHRGLQKLPWGELDYLLIENVGNLVCPAAMYDLGQSANVVAMSVAEGEDKPIRYPLMFRTADLVLITKVDLLPQLPEVSLHEIEHNLSFVMPRPAMLLVSGKTGLGIEQWVRWLRGVGNPRGAACAVSSPRGTV